MRKHLSGFTIVELITVLAIVVILVSVVMDATGSGSGSNSISWGMNGMTETRCIGGYRFVVGEQGQARQIMDEAGRGIRCD